MVKGLKLFTDYFYDYQDSYVLIGGAAADIWLENSNLPFRLTRDLDIILVIEALKKDFVLHFWEFVKKGKYKTLQKSNGKPKVYRFVKPDEEEYPFQLEIFSRKPDILGDLEKAHLTPIPLGEELSSLSAILMNDDYYEMAKTNSDIIDGLHLATAPALICLKTKAFLDIMDRLKKGEWKNNNEKNKLQKDYKKHRNDIIRISLILKRNEKIILTNSIKEDITLYIETIKDQPPDYKQLAKNFEIPEIIPYEIFELLKSTFKL